MANEDESQNKGAGEPLRIFRCEASAEYAKRVMAHTDIDFALKCLVLLRKLNQGTDNDGLLREALWNAAIIRLFSVFDGPNALRKDILNELPEGAHEAFRFFEAYRSKHIAHKVNPFDQIKAGVILSDPNSGVREVVGIGNLAMTDASFADPEFVNSLIALVESLLKQVEKEIRHWSDHTLREARTRDIEELYKLPALRIVVPESGHLRKGRE